MIFGSDHLTTCQGKDNNTRHLDVKQRYETVYSVRIPLGGREGDIYVLGRCFASQHAMIFVAIGFI